jgi:hypothetical protein
MATATALRLQIEESLATRFPAALSPVPRTIRETQETGIAEVDVLLEGGLPVGAISEVIGPESSGRTTLSLRFVARCTARGQVCAWVDAGDTLDPESAAASGVLLPQLLWIRCTGDNAAAPATNNKRMRKVWSHLDQALRATDLLLQAGGFAALVLDLGSVDPAQGMRIPLATWFRFRQAANRTRCSLLVLGRASYAQSSAAVVLDCASLHPEALGGRVLHGCGFMMSRRRERFTQLSQQQRKPPAMTWSACTAWAAEKSA